MVMTVSAASVAEQVPAGGEPKNSIASGISAVSSSRLPSSWRVVVADALQAARRRRPAWTSPRPAPGATACRSSVAVDASRATCGGTSIEQMSCTSIRRSARALETAISNSRSPAGAGGEVRRACGVGISAYGASVPCSEPVRLSTREYGRSSGICAQPGQRAGRVEQRHLDAAAGGQVAQRAEQRRLAAAGLGDEHGQAGALADLHREVQVEEDRPAAGAGGTPDQVAAPVAHGGRGLRQRGGEQLDRHPAQVAGVGDRLAGDELAGQPVLVLRVLQRDRAARAE